MSADMLFEKLNYSKCSSANMIQYSVGFDDTITFYLRAKKVSRRAREYKPELIQAIAVKCQELGWF